jgi:NADPH:quinone reductase
MVVIYVFDGGEEEQSLPSRSPLTRSRLKTLTNEGDMRHAPSRHAERCDTICLTYCDNTVKGRLKGRFLREGAAKFDPTVVFLRMEQKLGLDTSNSFIHSFIHQNTMPSSSSIPKTMKAVVVREYGGIDALSYETDFPVPELSDGNVLVRNELCGLNFIDTYYRSGLYKQDLPFVSGQEGGGTVVAVSSSVSEIKVGDQVLYMKLGTYCEYTAVPASQLVKLPSGISMEKALACMVQGLTAHYLVTDATVGLIQPGDWCLIYSVGSGTCQWAAQMAKLKGYKVIGTTSTTKTAPSCCDEVIVLETIQGKTYSDFTSVDIVQKVMEITHSEGVKLILDGVGKSTSDISVQCLSRRGIWISFGNASGAVPPFSLLKLTPKSAFCTRPKLADYVATKDELDRRVQDVFGWVIDGNLDVKIDQVFPLADAQQAHAYLESGQSQGKILFQI